MKKEIAIFLERARRFYENAVENSKKGYNDLALFFIEQACQLIIKAKLLDLVGDFPKIHDLLFLLDTLSKHIPELKVFIEKNKLEIVRLTDVYITSRYFPREFYKEEVDRALEFYNKLRDLLWKE